MDEDNPDQTILSEEVARANAEYGTNLTVEGILRGASKHDVTWAARLTAWGGLLGVLLGVAGIAFWMSVVSPSSGVRAVFIVIGVIFLGLSFIPSRAAWRMFRNMNREDRAIDAVVRRVDARHTAREQGWAG